MLIKILVITIATIVSAQENTSMYDAYIKQHKGKRDTKIIEKHKNDNCLKIANEYITYSPQKKKMPDYNNALKTLKECALSNKNPIAAWEALFVMNSYSNLKEPQSREDYKKISQILYDDKSCDGYIGYGDVFSKGIAQDINQKKAIEIYKEGLTLCSDSWHKVVLEMRISSISTGVKK